MVWRCEFMPAKSIAILPLGKKVVMTVIRLKSACDALVTKIVHAVYSLPLKIAGIWFRCNLKMLYLVIDSCFMVSDAVQSALPSKFISREKANEPEATVRHDEIVQGVKKIRRSTLMNISKYYQLKFKANTQEAVQRLDDLRNCLRYRKGPEAFQEAMQRLNDMKKRHKDEEMELFKEVDDINIDDIIEGHRKARIAKENERKNNEIKAAGQNIVSSISDRVTLGMNVCYEHLNDIRKHITSRRKNGVSKNRLNTKNKKLEQIFKVSSNLVGQLDRLNQQVSHLAEVSERMVDMQHELGVGRKLLSEVEADRNEMKRKLSTLERLIKEEEKYLDEFSNESGFDENEMQVSL